MGNQPGSHLQPVYNPPVPFRGMLPMGPTRGSSVVINGTTPSWCNRFEINLETEGGDKALHFNPRFEGMNAVIRNTCRQGAWGSEEKGGHFPFHIGSQFEITITLEERCYKISVNGGHFCEYSHRIPLDYVRVLTVSGDVQLNQIRFNAPSSYYPTGHHAPHHHHHQHHSGGMPAPPSYGPPSSSYSPGGGYPSAYGSQPVYNPPMPCNVPISGGMAPGKMIRISGSPSYSPSRFNVNLVRGNGFRSNADLALHCDVRFHYGDSHNIVVRTHRQNGNFGNEERQASFFPFQPGQPFEMLIRAEHDKYMIAVNNQHMFEFRHRIHPLMQFDHLYIEGDVNINSIVFQ